MGASTKKEYVGHFYDVLQRNEDALNHLSNIRIKFSAYSAEPWKGKVGKITKEYDQCIGAIQGMLDSYKLLVNALSLYLSWKDKNLHKTIRRADKMGIENVLGLEAIIDGARPKEETFGFLEKLYETTEKLNVATQGSKIKGKVITLHDCIRYLHQRSINMLFEAVKNSTTKIYHKKFKNIAEIEAIDVEKNASKQGLMKYFAYQQKNYKKIKNLALRGLLESYASLTKDPEIDCSEQEVKILVKDDSFLSQIKLGCHYAKLETQINDADPFILLTYRDTDYEFSQNRLVYAKLVLWKLGYIVEVKDKIINASLHHKSKKQTYGTLKETMRLLVSTSDLDMTEEINNREYEAVYRFLHGETNIKSALGTKKKIKSKKCKKFISKYESKWDMINL